MKIYKVTTKLQLMSRVKTYSLYFCEHCEQLFTNQKICAIMSINYSMIGGIKVGK